MRGAVAVAVAVATTVAGSPVSLMDGGASRWGGALLESVRLSRTGRSLASSPSERRGILAEVLRKAELMMQAGGTLSPDEALVIGEVLLPTVRDDIQPAVLREFETAQGLFSEKVDELKVVSVHANLSLSVAQTADSGLDSCRSLQKERLQALDICSKQEDQRRNASQTACDEARRAADAACLAVESASSAVKKEVHADMSAGCDFAHAGPHKVGQLLDRFKELEQSVRLQSETFQNLRQQCSRLREAAMDPCVVGVADSACDAIRADAEASASQCEHRMAAALIAKCGFGSALQHRCSGIEEVEELQRRIRQPSRNDSWSEPDRQDEWRMLQNVTCILSALQDQSDLSPVAIAACVDGQPYPREFDFRVQDIQAVVEDSMKCSGPVTFSGFTWSVGANYEDFQRLPDHPEFEEGSQLAPFAFCAAATL